MVVQEEKLWARVGSDTKRFVRPQGGIFRKQSSLVPSPRFVRQRLHQLLWLEVDMKEEDISSRDTTDLRCRRCGTDLGVVLYGTHMGHNVGPRRQ